MKTELLYLSTGALLGGCATYLLTNKHLNAKYALRADREIEEMLQWRRSEPYIQEDLKKTEEIYTNPGLPADYPVSNLGQRLDKKSLGAAIEIMNEGGYGDTKSTDDILEKTRPSTVEPDYNLENGFVASPRDTEAPYVIKYEEFMEDGPDDKHHAKISINYYAGDDILCDDKDEVVPEVDSLIGSEALTQFGRNSQDPDIVYVRNEGISVDFEVVRDERRYDECVLGFRDPERKARKFKED